MTDPTNTAQQAAYAPGPGSSMYAPPIPEERQVDLLANLERMQREHREASNRIDNAWQSPEAKKIREIVREDDNVDWLEFVKHCGGILEVVKMVDDYDLPDTDRIIPKVDELFNKYAQAEVDRGSVFRRHPRNRPYVAGRGTAAGEARAAAKRAMFPGDRDAREGDAAALLRAEREEAARPRTTHPR